jgi:DNA-binding transcriptional LysR family regulator
MSRHFEPVQLGSIELFCRAAELGSFTAAAQALGLTPAAVSRSIARLEARLKVKLFVRTTRQVRLTDDGRLYFEHCRQALGQIESAERAITGRQGQPVGTLRISVPTTYAHHRLLPLLPRLMDRHPQLAVELNVSNRNIDFVEEGYDLAIRAGTPPDSRLVARMLEDAALGVYASPAYLRKHGTPRSLEELRHHACMQFELPSTGRPMPWVFVVDGREVDFTVDGRWRVSDDVLGCVSLARSGAGLCQTFDFVAAEAVQHGELVEVLRELRGRSRPFSVMYPHNRHLSAGVKAFVDFLLNEVQGASLRRGRPAPSRQRTARAPRTSG